MWDLAFSIMSFVRTETGSAEIQKGISGFEKQFRKP